MDGYCPSCRKAVSRLAEAIKYADRFDEFVGARPKACCPMCGTALVRRDEIVPPPATPNKESE